MKVLCISAGIHGGMYHYSTEFARQLSEYVEVGLIIGHIDEKLQNLSKITAIEVSYEKKDFLKGMSLLPLFMILVCIQAHIL